ncbi:hypothetical protein GF373_10035 [bacterium]|nr:hypothetical protein [bacterium]
MAYIESRSLSAGFWGNYIQAGALKLQDEHPQTPLKGMNVMIDGDIPPNAGVSSSSTLVVGSLLALCQINKIPLAWDELVERAGSAEWYVGTRGGAGDHAAMLLGRYRKILHAGFKPFTTSYFPFPEQVDVFLLLSGIDSRKSAETKHTFNSRIASYELALHLFHAAWPAFQAKIPLIRDIHPEQMGISLAQLYQTIKKIPVQATWAELQQEYPCPRDEIARIAKMYQVGTEPLPLREVFLFGIAECQRAKQFPELLEKGGIQEAGELMYISHNGDRVASWVHETPRPYRSAFTDAYLDRLSHLAEKGAPEADLHVQPGGYRCSLPEMDLIVDICKHIPGIYGAGLTGAGLGGAIVALADRAKTNTIQAMLKEFMNDLALHRAKIELCRPVAGAAFIEPPPA